MMTPEQRARVRQCLINPQHWYETDLVIDAIDRALEDPQTKTGSMAACLLAAYYEKPYNWGVASLADFTDPAPWFRVAQAAIDHMSYIKDLKD